MNPPQYAIATEIPWAKVGKQIANSLGGDSAYFSLLFAAMTTDGVNYADAKVSQLIELTVNLAIATKMTITAEITNIFKNINDSANQAIIDYANKNAAFANNLNAAVIAQNPTIFNLSTDPATLNPNTQNVGGTSGGQGLIGAGAGYQYTMNSKYVNEGGIANVASSNIAAEGIRPGNHSIAQTPEIINALRSQTVSGSELLVINAPTNAVRSEFTTIYHGNNSS